MYFEEKFSYSHSKRRAKNGVKGRGAFGKSAAGGEYKDTTLAICQKASTLGISDHEAPQEKRRATDLVSRKQISQSRWLNAM